MIQKHVGGAEDPAEIWTEDIRRKRQIGVGPLDSDGVKRHLRGRHLSVLNLKFNFISDGGCTREEQIALSLKRHLFPHGGREPKAFWICFSRVHPPSEIKSNFKFKKLKRHLLKRHLTLSDRCVPVSGPSQARRLQKRRDAALSAVASHRMPKSRKRRTIIKRDTSTQTIWGLQRTTLSQGRWLGGFKRRAVPDLGSSIPSFCPSWDDPDFWWDVSSGGEGGHVKGRYLIMGFRCELSLGKSVVRVLFLRPSRHGKRRLDRKHRTELWRIPL